MRNVLVLLVVLAGAAHADAPTLTVQDLPDHAIQVDTPLERVVLDPSNGGRVRSFVVKSTGDDLTWWDPASRRGGLLDEQGDFTVAHFTATTVMQTASKYTVALSADSPDGVRVTKTLAFNAVTPVVEVTYRFENRSREAVESHDPPLFVRAFIRASGKSGADDEYSLPMSEGVVHATARTFARHPDTADPLWTRLSDGWGALINKRTAQGLAIVFEDDAVDGVVASHARDAASTFEWAYRALEHGRFFETKLMIVPISGMHAIDHANHVVAINILPDAIEGTGLWQPTVNVKLVVRDLDADGKLLTEHEAIDLGTLPVASAARIPAKLPPRAPHTALRELHLSNDVREVAVFRETVTTGVSRALQRAQLPAFPSKPLPDLAAPAAFTPPIAESDRQRGFALYAHDTESTSHPLDRLDFDLAPELRDSQTVDIWPLAAGTAIPVVLEPSASADAAWLAAHVLVRCEIEVPPPKVVRGRVESFHQLWPVKTINAAPDHETPLWITIRGRGLAAGDYAFDLRIGPTRVPVHVKVWPVTLPARPRVNLEMEHAMLMLPGSNVKDGPPHTLDLFLDDLTEHGVNTAQLQPAVGATLAHITLKGSTELLSHWLRTHPALDRGPFPELDFSALNPWADAALAHGMTRVTTNFGDMQSAFHSEEATKWYLRELRRWIISRGFDANETYIKVMDEVRPDQLLDLAHAMTLVHDAGWKPFSTFSTVLRYPRQSRAIASVASVWQFAGWPAAEYAERTATRDVPADQEMWTYIGKGTAARTYQAMRSHGWEVALARLDGFHGHEYYRWAALAMAAIITIDKDRPIDSPAWEGIADGIADARLLAELIHRLDGRAKLRGHLADVDGPAARVVAPIVGRDKHAILRVGIRRPDDLDVVSVLDAEDVATVAKYRAARRAVLEKLAAKP